MKQKLLLASSILLALPAMADVANNGVSYPVPADKFDMRNWKITIPSDINQDAAWTK
ncbi:alginate lyase precursor [Vibrio ishigakensis]|uniref:Alginate lyase n=1 Tax=Vibrio ishigakensis TaxID=1481914 RepID=A0A0B8P0Z1_9VIBR|nr:alginate lyase precursor [Vibrio ishigakensis]